MSKLSNNNYIIAKYKSPLTFYFLAILIPWILWFVSAYLSHKTPYTPALEWATGITIFAGLLAPVIIALFYMLPDKEMRKDFLGRFFNFRSIGAEYILIAFFLMLFSILAAQAISLFFGYSTDQFELRGSFTFTSAIFPVWFLLIAAPMLEELAWHSYGTDSLVSRFSLFTASMIFAIYWALWHFPLSFIKDYYHSNLVESGWVYSLNFVVSMIPFVLIINWLYYKTNRNILLTAVFHITAGFFNEIFATHPMSKVIQTGLLIILSVYLLIKDRELFFGRMGKIVPVILGVAFLSVSCDKSEMEEIDFLLNESETELHTIDHATIEHLPQNLQNYLDATGLIGETNSNSIKLKYEGNFKLNENAQWASMEAVTYVTNDPISRNWIGEIDSPMGKMTGLDYYYSGIGKLDIRLAPSVPFMFSEGYELSVSELIAFLGELVYNPSAFLNDQIRWEDVAENAVRATIEDAGLTVSGIFCFGTDSLIARFETNERYFGDTKEQLPWIVYVDDYQEFNALKIPTTFRAVWIKPEGEYEYINATITDLIFDIYEL